MADSEVGGVVAHGSGRSRAADAADAFALLGNETRLAILLAIWEEQVPLAPDNSVPFSRIFERVPIEDRGNCSYHLDKLEGRFLTQRGERGGYELLIPGLKLVRTIVAGTGIRETERGPTEIDVPCPRCGAATLISYRQGIVFHQCSSCPGTVPGRPELDGLLQGVSLEPGAVADRPPRELYTMMVATTLRRAENFFDGVCPTCSGPVESRLEAGRGHDADCVCPACAVREPVVARSECRVCKDFGGGSLARLALFHPAVVSLYDDHGVSVRVRADDHEAARRVSELIAGHEVEVTATAPPRAAVTVGVADEEVRLSFDESVRVVDVHR